MNQWDFVAKINSPLQSKLNVALHDAPTLHCHQRIVVTELRENHGIKEKTYYRFSCDRS